MSESKEVRELLDKILVHLGRLNLPVASLLQPGLDRLSIGTLAKELPTPLPGAAIEMYSWRNGLGDTGSVSLNHLSLIPGYHMMSLETAMVYYRTFVELNASPEFYPNIVWNPNWFPFLSDGSDGTYSVCCEDGANDGAIWWHLCGGDVMAYEDLHAFLCTTNACYEAGVFFMDQQGQLSVNRDRQTEIAGRYNPTIDYWQKKKNK